ncbi:MAG: LysR family transcriptional regulator [Nocardioides sp.]
MTRGVVLVCAVMSIETPVDKVHHMRSPGTKLIEKSVDDGQIWGRRMDQRLIQAFVTVADTGSVAGAATTLNYSQPRVSQHIQMFESMVGCRVFRRSSRGMVVTDSGACLLPVARVALHALDVMCSGAKTVSRGDTSVGRERRRR